MGRVESVNYNGNNRKLLFQLRGLHLFDVTVIQPFLFFTGWNASYDVYKLDATTGEVLRNYSINGGEPMGIVGYDYHRQPSGILNGIVFECARRRRYCLGTNLMVNAKYLAQNIFVL